MLAIIDAFYDAALDEALWPEAMKRLTEFTGSRAAAFWVLNSANATLSTFTHLNFDPRSIQEYVGGIARLDPTVRYLIAHPEEHIVHDGLLPDAKDDDTRAYEEWHKRSVETRFRMVAQCRIADTSQAGIALHRMSKAGRFEPADIARFAMLHRHLHRALTIGMRLSSLGAMQQFSYEWLDRNPAGVVLIDRLGRLVFANRRAQAIGACRDGIKLSSGGVTLPARAENARLQALMAQATGTGKIAPRDGAMRVTRPSGKRPYAIFVLPFSRRLPPLAISAPVLCVVISGSEEIALPTPHQLRQLFGLTPAEARLATLLAKGVDLRECAGKLGITYGTARGRLVQIFQKTETRRQGELVSRLLRLTPGS
jgi:DNA-binding CsgD family transcriptional regulator